MRPSKLGARSAVSITFDAQCLLRAFAGPAGIWLQIFIDAEEFRSDLCSLPSVVIVFLLLILLLLIIILILLTHAHLSNDF